MTSFPLRDRRSAIGVILLVALAITALSGCGSTSPVPHVTKKAGRYVALGDSFTAVSGYGPFTDNVCFRSAWNYPALVAKKLSITDFTDASCGGATSADLTTEQYPLGRGPNPPQLNSVTKDTTLVTLGIGLNNSDLSTTLLLTCLPAKGKLTGACKSYLKQPRATLAATLTEMGRQVAQDLTKIKAAAPHARVVLVGYPRLLAPNETCDSQIPLPTEALDRLRWAEAKVNEELQADAKAAKAAFINMYAASAGHDVCAANPWVNGQRVVSGQALPFHPFSSYHVAVAEKLYALLSKK